MSDEEKIKEACEALAAGRLVAFPTETVYGLGADAGNSQAVELLYKVKGRPENHPSIIHLASIEQVGDWCCDVPPAAEILGNMFWPGPLTLVLKKAPQVDLRVTGGQDTVAVRIPSHPIALSLLQEFARGVAAPSANRFGKLSSTSAEDIREEFGDEIEVILDGGPCQFGIESTIVDFSGAKPTILRPGMIIKESLNVAISDLGIELDYAGAGASAPRVPGSLPSHYAPNKAVQLAAHGTCAQAYGELIAAGKKPAVLAFGKAPGDATEWIVASNFASAYAHTLYRNLRKLDHTNADLILVESPPEDAEWVGINDRLLRASGGGQGDAADGS